MLSRRRLVWTAVVLICGAVAWFAHRRLYPPDDPAIVSTLESVTGDYRRIIVLMTGAEDLPAATFARCRAVGRRIFWRKQEALQDLTARLVADARNGGRSFEQLIRYLRRSSLRDADKLAFLDAVEEVAETAKLEQLAAMLDELRSIQTSYREEVTRIFSQFATRGDSGTREKWEAYIRFLSGVTTREQILAENPDIPIDEPDTATRGARANEIFGNDFAPKTVALTFDDGPHPKYTEQMAALLRKYGVRACFFQLGRNLQPAPNAEIARRLSESGHLLANHSWSHRMMSRLSDEERATEVRNTNLLLAKVAGQKPVLFRPPFGARNSKVLDLLEGEGMQNVMWTIDSLDWADPVPESIALRVLNALNRQHRGIILFHDIHKQSVMALPAVLDELVRQNYTFLTFEKGGFVKSAPPAGSDRAEYTAASTEAPKLKPYRQSWAVVIGINDYRNWPKLKYSVNDANAIEQELTNRFGFARENVIKLLDGDATRQRIMQVLGDDLANPERVQRDDRVFFFFAGHGATRTVGDGRQIGFIIPVDADRANYYSTAISMNNIREACDLIAAKHIYFVMDSCYSGLALTRAAGAFGRDRSYLEEVTRRTARQILTAGGADQQVADDGPNGHSVFTWALLQGLDGKADLDANGVITASELGAYVSPVVASFSRQTPAVGNLVGSEGGEFVFELKSETLTAMTAQLEGRALDLNARLESLEKEIESRQTDLLRLQQSIQAETNRLAQLAKNGQSPSQPVLSRASKPLSAYELDRLALRYYREKKYSDAEEALLQAVKLKPRDAILLNNLGFVYYRMGRLEDSRVWLEKTLAIDPRRKEAHGNIADVYLKLGRSDVAREHYREYLALFPASPRAEEVRTVLGQIR